MDLKTLQVAIATAKVADSAIATHQGKNVKVYHLTVGGLFIQKLWSVNHLKGSDNPFSVAVFIGCGPTPSDLIKGDLPKARDLKPDQFYWFQGWNNTTDQPYIYKAGMYGNVLMVGIGNEKPIRVTYYAVNGAEEAKVEIAPIEATPEVTIDTGAKRGTSEERREEHNDKETEFWRKYREKCEAEGHGNKGTSFPFTSKYESKSYNSNFDPDYKMEYVIKNLSPENREALTMMHPKHYIEGDDLVLEASEVPSVFAMHDKLKAMGIAYRLSEPVRAIEFDSRTPCRSGAR